MTKSIRIRTSTDVKYFLSKRHPGIILNLPLYVYLDCKRSVYTRAIIVPIYNDFSLIKGVINRPGGVYRLFFEPYSNENSNPKK